MIRFSNARAWPVAAVAVTLTLTAPDAARAQSPAFDRPLVSPEWLSQNLNDPKLVVVHVVNNRREYATGHLPGARMLWWGSLAPNTPDFTSELPPLAQLDSVIESLGISNDSKVVVYGQQLGPAAARAFVTLEYAGLGDRVALLDGGLAAWRQRGLPVSTETPAVKRGTFTPRIVASAVVDGDFVHKSIDKPGIKILDARTANFYNAEGQSMSPRNGHIPSAGNVPFNSLLDDKGMLKSAAAIGELLAAAGVKPGDRVVTYCHVGQQGSLLYFAAKLAGHQASLYDGSFEDWGARTEWPVVTPTKK